jgi:hypothetical protein
MTAKRQLYSLEKIMRIRCNTNHILIITKQIRLHHFQLMNNVNSKCIVENILFLSATSSSLYTMNDGDHVLAISFRHPNGLLLYVLIGCMKNDETNLIYP